MKNVFEHYEEEIRTQSIIELRNMIPGVYSTEEYENMFSHGLQGVMVLINESAKLEEFIQVIQTFPSLSSEDMKLVNMQLGLYNLTIGSKYEPMVVNESIDDNNKRYVAIENINVLIVTAIAAAIAFIIKFWEHIFAFLFTPTEKSKKMASNADEMKKDPRGDKKQKFINSTLKGKTKEQIAAYTEGKFLSESVFLNRYGDHKSGAYTIAHVKEAFDNYDFISENNGLANKVIDSFYELASFYMSDDFYKLLEAVVNEIEKINKLNPGADVVNLKGIKEITNSLLLKYMTNEAAAFNAIITNFAIAKKKSENEEEYRVGKDLCFGVFDNLSISIKTVGVTFNEKAPGSGLSYRVLNSSLPVFNAKLESYKVDLPGPEDRGAVTEKYIERYEANYDANDGSFEYNGFGKYSEFKKGNFKKTMEDHGRKLKALALRVSTFKPSHQANVIKSLINASKSNLAGSLTIVNKIFTDVYDKDIKAAEKLINEIRNHDRDTVAKEPDAKNKD